MMISPDDQERVDAIEQALLARQQPNELPHL
jgi:hypothetical protein